MDGPGVGQRLIEVEVDAVDLLELLLEAHGLEDVRGLLHRGRYLLVKQGAVQGLEVALERNEFLRRLLQLEALVAAGRQHGVEVGLDMPGVHLADLDGKVVQLAADGGLDARGGLDGVVERLLLSDFCSASSWRGASRPPAGGRRCARARTATTRTPG